MNSEKKYYTKCIYIICSIIWILLVLKFELYINNGLIICLIPLLIFLFAFMTSSSFTEDLKSDMFQAPIITICIVIVVNLIYRISDSNYTNRCFLIKSMSLAVVLSLISAVDIWVDKDKLSYWVYVRHCFQVMAIATVVCAMIEYTYSACSHKT